MYFINSSGKKNKKCVVDGCELISLDGFLMSSRKSSFVINNQHIRDVKVVDKDLASSLVSRKVLNKYKKIVLIITDLLISDDDSGDSFREALNQIEKFRLEIKNKYRSYLKKKDLEMMSKQLKALKKEANMRLIEIEDSYLMDKSNGKSR